MTGTHGEDHSNDAARHRRATEIFLAMVDLPSASRPAAIAAQCDGDPALERLVSAMLAADTEPDPNLDLADLLASTSEPRIDGDVLAGLPPTIDGFTLRGALGRGGMGLVLLAEQNRPRRMVALKVLREPLADDESMRRFAREANVLARLDHPGIASVISAGTFAHGGAILPYFAMNLVRGKPLTTYAADGDLDVESRVRLMIAVADAVEHAHGQGVIHRDLKPANILVTDDGRPVVLDFGVAHIAGAEDASLRTRTGQLMGTPSYMSPEQAGSQGAIVGPRTDVYAMGVILYELLVGVRPLDLTGQSLAVAMQRIRDTEPTRPSTIRPGLRGDVETILRTALAKDPARRYATAGAFAADLRRWLSREPILARPPTRLDRFVKLLRRNPTASTAIALAAVLLLGGTTWIALKNVELDRARSDSAGQAKSKGEALDRLLRLADRERLRRLIAQARDLWPAHPDKLAALDTWLVEARYVKSRLPMHIESLAAIEAGLERDANGGFSFPSMETAWEHELLESLVSDLRQFTQADTGTLAGVESRREWAATVEAKSITAHADAWADAARAVAAHESFKGLQLRPHLGLAPLGADPKTGLQEFLDIQSHEGPIPRRQADGTIPFTETTGIVFVLIPGGIAVIGAQAEDPTETHYDPEAQPDEGPVNSVRLDPFFVSKFECTQAQWIRVAGSNPSSMSAGAYLFGHWITRRHPVEQVSFTAVRDFCRRLAADLPTEAQWEWAARAGSGTIWSFGDRREDLPRYGNMADDASRGTWPPDWATEPGSDGYATHAPVGSFLPNAFGLFDVHGNVFEWTLDRLTPYTTPAAEGTGARHVEGKTSRILRGGSYFDRSAAHRCASHSAMPQESRNNLVGFRPVRPLVRAP